MSTFVLLVWIVTYVDNQQSHVTNLISKMINNRRNNILGTHHTNTHA